MANVGTGYSQDFHGSKTSKKYFPFSFNLKLRHLSLDISTKEVAREGVLIGEKNTRQV